MFKSSRGDSIAFDLLDAFDRAVFGRAIAVRLAVGLGQDMDFARPGLRRAGTQLESLCIATKNTGTKNTASTVEVIMPPNTAVPSARRLAAPAPVANTSGSTPRMNAKTGHQDRPEPHPRRLDRRLADRPCPASRSSRANSTIRIAFLLASAMISTTPICV